MPTVARSEQLLVVDDDPHVLNALRFAFEIDGYDVLTYGPGEDLLNAALPAAVCLIIDENLPGLSGLQTAAVLRDRQVDVPIILITTCPSRYLQHRARQAGVEIVEKPLVTDALARKVRQLVDQRGAARA
jgi:FixJ family two-component response regulator